MPRRFLPSLSETLKLRASVFFRAELAAPWGMALPAGVALRLHIVTKGSCWLGGSDLGKPVELQTGDIVLLTRGQAQWIADRPGRTLLTSEQATKSCAVRQPPFQDGQLTHRLLCVQAEVHDRGGGWLLSLLPAMLHFRQADIADERTWKVVEAINAESSPLGDDDSTVLDRLAEALFLCILSQAKKHELEIGRLGAAQRDPQIRKVLALMHTRLDDPWTIQSLAAQAGLSRATLARRFRAALGISAMDYLNQVRMAHAMELLLDGTDLGSVAARISYGSSEAFRKAFKRHTGKTPALYLRAAQPPI